MLNRSILSFVVISSCLIACSGASDDGSTGSSSAAIAGGALETFNGVTAHVYGGDCTDVFARSGTDVSYSGPGYLTDTCGYQCVELAVRYLHFKEGITGNWNVGTAIEMCDSHPGGVELTSRPGVGDLMIYKSNDGYYGTGAAGHVAVIRGVNGDGTLDVFNQRWGNESTAFVNGILPSHAACFLHSVNNESSGGNSGPPKVNKPTGCGAITEGQGLTAGEEVASCDKRFTLVMQSDSNLVLYDRGRALWSSETYGRGGKVATLQADGNLVVYDGSDRALWSTRTDGHPGARVALQDDGNLVTYSVAGQALWATGTNGE